MKNLLSVLIAFFIYSASHATNYKFDAAHSNLGFSVGHMGVSEITGSFNMKEATIVSKGSDLTDAEIGLTIDMKSIDTDNEKRDNHLRTADFFDTEKFPEGKFKSTSCKKSADQTYTLTGDLTMHGITKPVTLQLKIKSATNPMNNKPIHGVKVTGSIKRSDYAISPSTPVQILNDEVMIEANMEFSEE